ncbi:exodeoxyribonuclease V alpha subunit [Desulfitispora alkaliphila]
MEEYLASDLVKGVGKVTAKKIVENFGEESLQVCQKEPERLTLIKGISLKKAEEIKKNITEALEFQQVMMDLLPLGLTVKMSIKAYQKFGSNAVALIKENPYLLTKIPQVGFIKADQIAKNFNADPTSLDRVMAALEHLLFEEANSKGNLYSEREDLVSKCLELLNREQSEKLVDHNQVISALQQGAEQGKLILEGNNVYLSTFHFWECESAQRVKSLAVDNMREKEKEIEKELDGYQSRTGVLLTSHQQLAVKQAFEKKLSIVTGGPGTGKTQTIRAIIDIWSSLNQEAKILLAAPTGRAARRMKELTGMEAVTIHRMLGIGRGDDADIFEDVVADLIVIDEFSMVDIQLFYQLITAVDENTSLVFVGDTDQLPSVGPGNVLQDLIRAEIPCVVLNEIFRQARESQIVTNAHRVNSGDNLEVDQSKGDFFFIQESDGERVVELILKSVVRLIDAGYSAEDIQVLAPMKKTETGIDNLNKLIQKALNPQHINKRQIETKKEIYRVGDKVMQTVNNYDKEVFNGDVGVVYQIDEEQNLEVSFDDKIIKYTKDQLEELALAYAITVHKSQGSEYPVVIMPITTQHYVMLARNLLYTGITRAKEKVVLIGTKKAVNIAIQNNRVLKRKTGLTERINTSIIL